VRKLVEFALRLRTLVVVLFVMLLAAGIFAFNTLNIEAYPDPVPPLVEIITQNPGQSAEEMERYVTIPIETAVSTAPFMKVMRSSSMFGLSDIKMQFTYDLTYDEATQKILNLLGQMPPLAATQAQPTISPWSPVGEIMRYRLVGPPGYSVMDLKTLQDWVVKRRLRSVPGVIDVTSFGGRTKTFEIRVDFEKLVAFGLTLPRLIDTLEKSNINVGGQTINSGMQSAVVRGVGLIHSIDDIRDTMVTQVDGNPVRVSDIGEVIVGHEPRLGIIGLADDDDIVEGIVLMRRGAESTPTIQAVKAAVERINSTGVLPPGVHIERIYDRSDLIKITTHTVVHNVLFGIVLVFFVQWLFLGDLRSAIIVSSSIPFAFFFAITIMVLRDESANLLSVGAIDFGLIIDATVVMVENIFRHLAEATGHGHSQYVTHLRVPSGFDRKRAIIYRAASEVDNAILFSAMIIIAGFIPLFTLSGVEGHIFGPMSKTYAYALAGGLLATFTVAPALSSYLLPDRIEHGETRIVKWMSDGYGWLLDHAFDRKVATICCAAVLFAIAILAGRSLGLEFLPTLEEGNLWIRATMPPSISLEAGNETVNQIRQVIKSFPEVETVASHQGRPDDGTDPIGFFNAEFFAPLKPQEEWPNGVDKEKLTNILSQRLRDSFPGVEFSFSQAISDNVQEAISGVKGENSLKIFGGSLETLTEIGTKIKSVMSTIPGVADLTVYTSLGQPTVRIVVDRIAAGRYGLTPGDVNAAIQAAIGGQAAGDLYEDGSDRHFPIVVRLAPKYRENIEAISNLAIGVQDPATGKVTQIPLKELADVRLVSGASFIYREQQQRYVPVRFSVRGRDLGSTIYEAQRRIADEVHLPAGYRLEWAGSFGSLQDAIARLEVIVPLTIVLIGMLLYIHFASVVDMLLGLSVIPMAVIGGIFALVLTGTPFSVSAAIGFIALFGISVMEGIILLSYVNQLIDDGVDRETSIVQACKTRFRPVMMTCCAACVGLLPAAFSTAIGSQVQRPLALVVVGGILLAPALVLILFPVLISLFSRRKAATVPTDATLEPAE
jgi:cobalt-zinc-cadmium resistance protein CzcA